MKNIKRIIPLAFIYIIGLSSCYKEYTVIKDDGKNIEGEGLADWTINSHSGDAKPDYTEVFSDELVRRFDIVIDPNDWEIMQNDLSTIMSNSGGGPGQFSEETPVYIPCQVFYNEKQWYNVGIRYKGNSSLSSTYRNGNKKYPLRLKFDKFEDDFPEIKNQTFFGFSELSLANNFDDKSLMREKIANELFREFGVPAAHSAYYQVYIDYGDGPIYYGLYTTIEIVFDTMLEKQFGSNTGNCYKPENDGAAFSKSNFALADFEKKTNEDLADWSDIQSLYDALHANTRTTKQEEWKADMEKVFDIDGFLRWLAVNTTIQNWDTYGKMTHNYYLYNDPADGLLKWIPWDNNEAFQSGKMGGAYDFSFSGLNENSWPLIPYILGVESYKDQYDSYIRDFISEVFEPSKMEAKYNSNSRLIEAAATGEQTGYTFLTGSASFTSAVITLISHANSRNVAAEAYLE